MLGSGCRSVAPLMPSVSPPAEDEEVRISREFRREAKKYFKFLNQPEVERYVDRIARRILSATGPLSFDYRFFVVEDQQLNAFAVPGGSIYLFTGLIERAKSTDELAGVLGHEIVHIKGRHMARSSGPDAISVLSLLATVIVGAQWLGRTSRGYRRPSGRRHPPSRLQPSIGDGIRYFRDPLYGRRRLRSAWHAGVS